MDYKQLKIKNVLVAGHAGSGKTSLVEALLYMNKASDRLGRTDDGNTVTDFEAEEIKRKCSLSSAVAPFEYRDAKFNMIDVPGLFDFELGVYEGIKACESVLLTVSAKDGVEVGTQKAYKLAEKNKKGTMIYVSKVDVENADFYKVFEELKATFGPKICPTSVPVVTPSGTVYIDLIEFKAYSYKNGKAEEVMMPATGHRLDGLVTSMMEAVAETNEEYIKAKSLSFFASGASEDSFDAVASRSLGDTPHALNSFIICIIISERDESQNVKVIHFVHKSFRARAFRSCYETSGRKYRSQR